MQKVGNLVLLALILATVSSLGCRRESRTPPRSAQRFVRAAPAWGPESEGLQVRLRPTRRVWGPGETLTFKLDIRNRGRRLFAFDAREPIGVDRVALDDRWRRRRRSRRAARMRPLGPDTELADLVLALPPTVGLPLTPGPHNLRVAFSLEGVEVVSNAVGIEIAAAP